MAAIPIVSELGKSRGLKIAGEKVEQLITLARQNSISKKAQTALVLLTTERSEANYRALTIVERQGDGCWRQISNWHPLPIGITVDLDRRHCTFLANSPMLSGLNDGMIGYCDQTLARSEFACRVFLPNGSLSNPYVPAKIRLVEGSIETSGMEAAVHYAHPSRGGASRFYDIAILGATGAVKVTRQ